MHGSGLLQDEGSHQASPGSLFFGFGKLQSRESIDTPGNPQTISSLSTSTSEGAMSVYCRRLRRAFLVDSGADVSVFPASASQKKSGNDSVKCLHAANGSSIKTFGKRKIFLSFAGLSVGHVFLLADVRRPILGSDFFRANDLMIDVAGCRLVKSSDSKLSAAAAVIKARPAVFTGGLCGLRSQPAVFRSVEDVFAAFPAVTASNPVYDSSCLLYTSPSPRDLSTSRMPSSA